MIWSKPHSKMVAELETKSSNSKPLGPCPILCCSELIWKKALLTELENRVPKWTDLLPIPPPHPAPCSTPSPSNNSSGLDVQEREEKQSKTGREQNKKGREK